MESIVCPFCGVQIRDSQATRCKSCANAISVGTDGVVPASRLSDEELGERLQALSARYKILIAPIIVFGVITLASAVMSIPVVAVGSFVVAFVLAVMAMSAHGKMSILLKTNVVADALAEMFPDSVYTQNACFSEKYIHASGLFSNWNKHTGNDCIRGKYKGHIFAFSDIHLIKETKVDRDGKDDTREETVFLGQWMMIKLEKQLPSMVLIRENAERKGLSKKILGDYRGGKDDITTENAAFNEQFQISTSDPQTAFYVLTPHFMEYIMAADRQANGRTFLSFSGEYVHIAVWTNRDSFEVNPTSVESKDIGALRQRVHSEIRYITGILDELLQNDFLFGEGK